MRKHYLIVTVVPSGKRHFPPLREAVASMVTGSCVPITVATRWAEIRRSLSPGGLKRKAKEARN